MAKAGDQLYAVAPTREGLEGVKDKAAIMNALAKRVAEYDREFIDTVRKVVAPAGNSSEQQVYAWAAHVRKLPYHREFGEIFASPKETLKSGGDCDDLTLLALAGFHALAIPCCPDIVTKRDPQTGTDNGVHVRARVGLPPTDPPRDLAQWRVFDPVEESERQWAMLPQDTPLPQLGQSVGITGDMVLTGMAGESMAGDAATSAATLTTASATGKGGLALLALIAFGGIAFWLARSPGSSPHKSSSNESVEKPWHQRDYKPGF